MANYGARNGEEQSGEKCPPGLHRAALVGMFDLGNQPGFTAEDSPQQKVALVWQVDKADSKGRPFTMLDTVASYLSGPTAKKKSKFAERVEALIARPLTEDDLRVGVDDSMLLGKSAQLFVAPPGEGGKWPKIVQVIGLLGNPPMGGLTLMGEGSMPKHVEAFVVKARGKAVGGWKAPTPTPANKSAVAATGGGALPSQPKADDIPPPF